jgi:hypothetical protein
MRWKWKRAIFVGALGLLAGGAVGCAEERAPINRVQPNALAKSFFVGADLKDTTDDPEFWARTMVTDVGYGAAQDGIFSSSWAMADLTRIKWVIQEDLLLGRITYERIEGTDHKGVGKATTDGVIAFAFPVLSHFDIRRDYNPATGEESNIIVENTSDRPWYEREYMRVDWSRNLNTDSYDFDTLSLMGVYGGVHYEPLSYYVNDPDSDDAPVFASEEGYFDVTTKAFATPQLIDLSSFGWGIDAFPACFLDNDFMHGSFPAGNCNPVEITLRHSFRRVVDNDFEPEHWDGLRFQAYGAFTNERYGYARNYGMSDDQWYRFINRYNIWEKSHATDAAGNAVECFTPTTTPAGCDPHRDGDGPAECYAGGEVAAPNGTEDECEAVGRGSRCDTFSQKCTLPYRDRVAKPVVWYYTKGSNPDYYDGTEWATHEWDVAMRSAVMVAKYAECKRLGDEDCSRYPVYFGQMDDNADAVWLAREVDDCRNGLAYAGQDCAALADKLGGERKMDAGVIALAKLPEMVVLCHSPVAEGDSPLCGERGKVVRMGDLRYHNVNSFTSPQTPSAWGIYTDSEDPLTGEKISASINIWTHVNDLFSQGVIDVARYIKGELETGDVTDGTFVQDWAKANERASAGSVLPHLTRSEANNQIADFIGMDRNKFADVMDGKIQVKESANAKLLSKKAMDVVREARAEVGAPQANRAVYAARRAAARDTQLEAELLSPAMQQYAGVEGMPLEGAILEKASPLRGMNPSARREMNQMRDVLLAERGSCLLEDPTASPAPLAVHALADILEEKFGAFNPDDPKEVQLERAERMRKWLAQRAQYGVIIHEMGHSIGMRHNFLSSSDAFGYRPQYWQLRTKNGALTDKEECDELDPTGESCVGPRWLDPVTEDERKNLIWMWSQSSVMDYPGDQTQDTIGLGAYDFAAARMFYGDMVAVFQDSSYKKGENRADGVLDRLDSFGGILGLQYVIGSQPIHYSQLNAEYDLITPGSCEEVDPELYRPATWNTERDGEWHPLMDGLIVQVDGKYTRCKQQKVDYVPWTSLESVDPQPWRKGIRAYDLEGRTRVPYPFATDNWADLGNLSVYRHDNGADAYELVNFWIAQSEVGHIFDNYRRHRQSFSVRSAADRTLGRYSEKMRDAAKGLGLLRNIAANIALDGGSSPDSVWLGWAKDPQVRDVVLMSGMVFDHFTRQLARPAPSAHLKAGSDPVLRSGDGDSNFSGSPRVLIPNGAAAGGYSDVMLGGRLLENRLSETNGDYDSSYTMNAGTYYDKVNTAYLMTESVDNFISDSRDDFLDSRYRAVSLADLFPDGFRRWLANNLTGDDFIKGPRLASDASGNPELDPEISLTPREEELAGCGADDPRCRYPARPIGWTSWWPTEGPESCFPANGVTACNRYGAGHGEFNPQAPADVVAIDPQVGWEQQKWLIANTLIYLPENQQQRWAEQLALYEVGQDLDPGFANRIEFHNPIGKTYIAQTFGKEDIFGKTVQKGIAARTLEWANELLKKAYQTTDGPDLDGDGAPDWYLPKLDASGQPVVTNKAFAEKLERYVEVLWFLSRSPFWLNVDIKGVY